MYKALLLAVLFLVGCGEQEREATIEENSFSGFYTLCTNEELYICGDDVPIDDYNGAGLYDLILYSIDNMNTFEYTPDNFNEFIYMNENPKKGDCEDWALTFIEDNIRNGNLLSAKLIVGKLGEDYHAWVKVGNVVFDNNRPHGTNVIDAYKELFILYEFNR